MDIILNNFKNIKNVKVKNKKLTKYFLILNFLLTFNLITSKKFVMKNVILVFQYIFVMNVKGLIETD